MRAGELVKVQTIRNIFKKGSVVEADRRDLSLLVEKFVFVEGVGLAARQPPVEMKERIQNRVKSRKAIQLQADPEKDSLWKQLGQACAHITHDKNVSRILEYVIGIYLTFGKVAPQQ